MQARAVVRRILAELVEEPTLGYWSIPAGLSQQSPIRVLPAGCMDASYAERVRAMDWQSLFARYADAFEDLRQVWREHYDLVLVDSRTGITDSSGLSTIVIPDKLVLVFTPNRQSLEGVVSYGQQAIDLAKSLPHPRHLPLFPLMARVEAAEELLRDAWLREAASLFAPLCSPQSSIPMILKYFRDIHVPHNSYLAYGERIAVLSASLDSFGSPARAFRLFADVLSFPTLSEWLLRVQNPPSESPGYDILTVSEEGQISIPSGLARGEAHRTNIPLNSAEIHDLRRSNQPMNPGWKEIVRDLRRGIEEARQHQPETLHLFALLPYPAAVALGRLMDQHMRAGSKWIYQLDPGDGSWWPFSSPEVSSNPTADPYQPTTEHGVVNEAGRGTVVMIEGSRRSDPQSLQELVTVQHARAWYCLHQSRAAPMAPAQARAAIDRVHSLLDELQRTYPGEPVSITFTGPVALAVEVGRYLRPSVFGDITVCQYIPTENRFVPALDLRWLQDPTPTG